MADKFIEKIEIEKFKCFNNFKADGFKRINLIGGRNNVGKTTLLEACSLSITVSVQELYYALLAIKTSRDIVNVLKYPEINNEDIRTLIKQKEFTIITNISLTSYKSKDDKYIIHYLKKSQAKTYSELYDLIREKVPAKYVFSSSFLSTNVLDNGLSKMLIDELKKTNRYDELNEYLKDIFNIHSIDIIDDKPSIKKTKEGNYMPLSSFGQGLKSFTNMILSLLCHQRYIFIDEIENGIHYTLHDKMWEIIFKISKEKNIQVFATTHSKECIESYYRVSKKLKEDDISYINLSTNKDDEIIAITLDSGMFRSEIEQNHEIRAW